MKLIIQIPCYNEEETLDITLKCLPRKVNGFTKVEWLVINDGSTDNTVKVAKKMGVDHFVNFSHNRGLAKAYMAGLEACVKYGADVIVNLDADNQYNADDIPKLVQPILEQKADIVIGARPISDIKHFSLIKKLLQKLGSYVIRKVSNTDIPDAPSGYRAVTRDAAMKLNVFNNYTYTLETIIQAGRKDMAITWVPISVNEDLRPSRLVKSITSYVTRSLGTMFRIFVVYKPFSFFVRIGVLLSLAGIMIGGRFLYYKLFFGMGTGKVQSLILASILIGIGFQIILVAFLADLLSVNRKLLEEIQYRLRKQDNLEHKKPAVRKKK